MCQELLPASYSITESSKQSWEGRGYYHLNFLDGKTEEEDFNFSKVTQVVIGRPWIPAPSEEVISTASLRYHFFFF